MNSSEQSANYITSEEYEQYFKRGRHLRSKALCIFFKEIKSRVCKLGFQQQDKHKY